MIFLQKSTYFYACLFVSSFVLAQTSKCDTSLNNDASVEIHEEANITFYGNLTNGGNIETRANSNTTLKGNLINNGDFKIDTNNSGGTVTIENQDMELSISGTNTPEFSDFIVNVDNNVTTSVPIDIKQGLLFEKGIVYTPRSSADFPVNLINDAVYVGSEDSRHIDGYTSYQGELAHTFPIGDDNRLRTISIEESASSNTTKAAYFFENPRDTEEFPLSFDLSIRERDISNISQAEFWDLDGNKPTKATLTWDIMSNISQILDTEGLDKLIVVGWNKERQEWVSLGNVSTTGDFRNGSITSDTFIPDEYEIITFATNSRLSTPDGIEVFNGISAGDDNNLNDYLIIKNIRNFPNNTLKIFNRWGVKVYEANNYDADIKTRAPQPQKAFRGKSNGRITVEEDELLPVGTYYYVLEYEVDEFGGQKSLAGYLYINR